MFTCNYLIAVTLLLSQLQSTGAFASWMTKDFCRRSLEVGEIIMNNEVVLSNEREIRVFRPTEGEDSSDLSKMTELHSGDAYSPGETMMVTLSNTKPQFVYEVTGGAATFEKGGCDNERRIADTAVAKLILPVGTEAFKNISLVAGWAPGHGTVNLTPKFVLMPKLSLPQVVTAEKPLRGEGATNSETTTNMNRTNPFNGLNVKGRRMESFAERFEKLKHTKEQARNDTGSPERDRVNHRGEAITSSDVKEALQATSAKAVAESVAVDKTAVGDGSDIKTNLRQRGAAAAEQSKASGLDEGIKGRMKQKGLDFGRGRRRRSSGVLDEADVALPATIDESKSAPRRSIHRPHPPFSWFRWVRHVLLGLGAIFAILIVCSFSYVSWQSRFRVWRGIKRFFGMNVVEE